MFKEYPPLEDKMFQIMDNTGKVINKKYFPDVSDEQVVKAYKEMLFARTADLMTVSFQRQGRIYTYPPNLGQEAIHRGVGDLITDDDWLVPAFREMGTYLAKGVSLKELYLYYMGYEDGTAFKDAKKILPIAVPIASQLQHAAGIGYSIKYKKEKGIVYAFVGDGGTSEGDFHEALNFAAVWNVPVVFVVQNNQYGISTPFRVQTASVNIAVKALAYGMEGIKVDGNDYFAMYEATKQAAEHAKTGKGPVLIEALTYRKGAHTTSDDPTKYRTKEEEEEWAETDPLKRLKAWLLAKDLFSDKEEEKLLEDYKQEASRQFKEAENYPAYPADDVFDYLYDDMPEDLQRQKEEYKKFLAAKNQ